MSRWEFHRAEYEFARSLSQFAVRIVARLGVSLAIDSTTFEKIDPQESGMDMLLMTTSKQLASSDIVGSSDDDIVLRHFNFAFSNECGR